MKQLLLIFFGVLIVSCSKNPVPKPDNLLSEEVIKDILFDAAIIQAAEVASPNGLADNNIKATTFIYEKYKIDSITYYQNQKYYAADLKKYKKMYKEVLKRLEEMQAASDTKNNIISEENSKEEVVK